MTAMSSENPRPLQSLPSETDTAEIIEIILSTFPVEGDQLNDFLNTTIYSKVRSGEFNRDAQTSDHLDKNRDLTKIKKALEEIDAGSIDVISIKINNNEPIKIESTLALSGLIRYLNDATGELDPLLPATEKAGRRPKKHKNFASIDVIIDAFCFLNNLPGSFSTNEKLFFAGLVLAIGGVLYPPSTHPSMSRPDYRNDMVQRTKSIKNRPDEELKFVLTIIHCDEPIPSPHLIISLKELWPKDHQLIDCAHNHFEKYLKRE